MASDGSRDIRNLSKTQIDRLGDRLRKGNASDADLHLLDAYRRTFAEAYDQVIRVIRNEVGLEPTGRPAKTTISISEKLRRESIRLTQIQDIAGCRLVVHDIAAQERVVDGLCQVFDKVDVVDRRIDPSHGYRAVHVIVRQGSKLIEIQLRTSLQQLWAELSEKFSDIFDPAIKYGGGDASVRTPLLQASALFAQLESIEQALIALRPREGALPKVGSKAAEEARLKKQNLEQDLDRLEAHVGRVFQKLVKLILET